MFRRIDSEILFQINSENFIFTAEDYLLKTFLDFTEQRTMADHVHIAVAPFSGLQSDLQSTFLENFRSLCLIKNIQADDRMRALFHLHLTGPAKVWYDALPNANKDMWEHLEAAFDQRYGGDLNPAQLQVENA